MKFFCAWLFIVSALAYSAFNIPNKATMRSSANIALPDTVKKPVVVLEEKTMEPMLVLMIQDTAATEVSIGVHLNKAYEELFSFISQHDLLTGKVIAFYFSASPPFILEAAVEVNKFPEQTSGRVRINKVPGGDVVIAHYTGPYDRIDTAYSMLYGRIKSANKTFFGVPFEVYLNSPVYVKDSFELRIDIYQLIKQQ